MQKNKIESDLLSIIKSKSETEVYYAVMSMIGGTYHFEKDYLNKTPKGVIYTYLEKILLIGGNIAKKDVKNNEIELIYSFCDNYKSLTLEKLKADSLINLKYSVRASWKKTIDKKTAAKISSFILASLILGNLIKGLSKDNSLIDEDKIVSDLENENKIKIEATIDDKLNIVKDEGIKSDKISSDELNDQIIEEFLSETKEEVTEKPVVEEVVAPLIITTVATTEEIAETTPQELTNEDKMNWILQEYNLTTEEFDTICAIVMSEAWVDSYEDAYAVINTIYNRTISKTWVTYLNRFYEKGSKKGESLYYQATFPGQFIVYENGRYKNNLGIREGNAYQAIIDFLFSKEIMHDYLSFKSSNTKVSDSEQFVPNGNNYHNLLIEDDRIENERSR